MQAQYKPQPYARLNNFHGPKRQLLGNHAGHAPPAWRSTVAGPSTGAYSAGLKGKQVDQGSKIFLSRLPMDVGETEVEELFKKTVGPLKESFLIYNSQGNSKGMAVVAFQRSGDAEIARSKYDGKIVDGRRPIKIEVIVESSGSSVPSRPPGPPSLFDRLQGVASVAAPAHVAQPRIAGGAGPMSLRFAIPTQPRRHQVSQPQTQPPRPATPYNATFPAPVPPRRIRNKKGPKRLKKFFEAKSREQLDRDMEDYRAQSALEG
ncbi:hypothetical protein C8J57DRAFT_1323806 [Mycena rebaudengoi]|nr:hypothetical protein C8J57DRAFT_1323806 [Mycena rebaudengoi]